MKLLSILVSSLLLCSCSLIPAKRSEQEAVKTSQAVSTQHELTIRKAVESSKTVPIEIHDVETTQAISSDNIETKTKTTFPLWVTLCGSGIGILLIGFAAHKYLLSNPAVKAAVDLADTEIASVIRGLRSRASTSNSTAEQALHNSTIAELEAARGRISK